MIFHIFFIKLVFKQPLFVFKAALFFNLLFVFAYNPVTQEGNGEHSQHRTNGTNYKVNIVSISPYSVSGAEH